MNETSTAMMSYNAMPSPAAVESNALMILNKAKQNGDVFCFTSASITCGICSNVTIATRRPFSLYKWNGKDGHVNSASHQLRLRNLEALKEAYAKMPGKRRPMPYRVLGVHKLYNNKWYLMKQSEQAPLFDPGTSTTIKLRLDLRLLEKKVVGVDMVLYSTVKDYTTYKDTDVHRNIAAKEIIRVEGNLLSLR